jgi:hypothetical protein
MKVFIRFLFIPLFVITYQISNIKDKNQIITFDLKKFPKITTVKLSDLGCVDINYVPLETNDQSFISGNFDLMSMGFRIIAGKDYYIVKNFNTIKKFRDDGTFVAKIGKEGRGPDEFLVAHDIDINKKNQEIYLVDAWDKRFYVYSEGGKFIRTFKCPLNTSHFRMNSDGIMCYSINSFQNVETSFNLIDTAGTIIKSFPNKYPWSIKANQKSLVLNENIFYEFNNQLFKKEIYSDTIYIYINGSFKPHIVIEQGQRLLTTKARSEFEQEDLLRDFISQEHLFEFGDYIFYEFSYGRSKYSFVGSKKSNFTALSINNLHNSFRRFKGFVNDIDGGPDLLPYAVKNDNILVYIIDALDLKKYVASEEFKNSTPKYPEKKKDLEKLANNLKETDNPILILVRLKD